MSTSLNEQSNSALSAGQYWLLVTLGGLTLLVAIAAIFFASSNQNLAAELQSRQQFIQQTLPLSKLNGELVQGIAKTAANIGDSELKALLERQGISFQRNAPVEAQP